MSPLSNAYVKPDHPPEPVYPLHARVCSDCRLVQIDAVTSPQAIFSDYLYFSSYSESWLRHAKHFADMTASRFALDNRSTVVEIASNDGYLLQYFQALGIPVLGIEPAANVAEIAMARSIPTQVTFFGATTAQRLIDQGVRPDLIVANNVLAHVPDLNDFVAGLRRLCGPTTIITIEVPHLLRLIQGNQFDTIYHEHFSYFSLGALQRILARHDLMVFDVDELSTHGGSLRLYCAASSARQCHQSASVSGIIAAENAACLNEASAYSGFAGVIKNLKTELVDFLRSARAAGKEIAGYGAPAKGNTLLNYCDIGPDLMAYTVDRSPHKQGLLLPGSHIPIRAPAAILATKPDYLVILPWNLRDEIMEQMRAIRAWGGRFVIPIPRLQIL
jgi:SAM-dependent methyltransferase